jgi:hypothetical protein
MPAGALVIDVFTPLCSDRDGLPSTRPTPVQRGR